MSESFKEGKRDVSMENLESKTNDELLLNELRNDERFVALCNSFRKEKNEIDRVSMNEDWETFQIDAKMRPLKMKVAEALKLYSLHAKRFPTREPNAGQKIEWLQAILNEIDAHGS